MKENYKRLINKNSGEKKQSRKKMIGSVMIVHLVAGLIKTTYEISAIASYKNKEYFPKRHEPFAVDINVKVDLSNYETKTDIKNISHINTSNFTLKLNWASLKTEVHKIILIN